MQEFIQQNGGVVATTVLVLISFNFVMSGLKAALEKIKDKTASQVDNKIYAIITKILTISEAIVDWLSGNREHPKDEPSKPSGP